MAPPESRPEGTEICSEWVPRRFLMRLAQQVVDLVDALSHVEVAVGSARSGEQRAGLGAALGADQGARALELRPRGCLRALGGLGEAERGGGELERAGEVVQLVGATRGHGQRDPVAVRAE